VQCANGVFAQSARRTIDPESAKSTPYCFGYRRLTVSFTH
jgi:hypothetical protein